MGDVLATNEIVQTNAEPAIRELKHALHEHQAINVGERSHEKRPLGDSVIHSCRINNVISEYTAEHNLPPPNFIYADTNSPTAFSLDQTLSALEMLDAFDPPKRAYLYRPALVKLLGIEEPYPPLSPLFTIPGHPWFHDFSRTDVVDLQTRIQDEHGLTLATVVQAGSIQAGGRSIKRWSPEQTIQVFETALPYFEQRDLTPMILSDAVLARDEHSRNTLQQYGDQKRIPVIFFSSLPELAAYAGTSSTTLSTDSGPAWVWEAERPDTTDNHAFIHHTTTNKFWLIPRGQGYFSAAIKNIPLTKNGSLVSFRDYEHFYGLSNPKSPAQDDVDKYCEAAEQFLQGT